ncbi:mechanosensitive ion channel, partial [bacterium]
AGRRIEKITTPFLSLDGSREPQWRALRRNTLRRAPKILTRTLLYTVALILVLDAFGLQILPLSLAVGAVALLFGSTLLPTLRDYAQGYALLSEDTLAPGDVVEIGNHAGTVEKWTLRATWLRDAQGRLHVLSNRDISDVVIHGRTVSADEPKAGKASFDPLDGAKATRKLPGK